ncbi:MAG: non-canonical purine NTP pyrophosphatase [Bacilli bacterium]|nr:non-canonical purine NTP pyrophosphatase [Bacilli bacterium]
MFSAKEASEKLKRCILKNDTGLFIEALGGFPGPYTHYVDEKIGEDGILKLTPLVIEVNTTGSSPYSQYSKRKIRRIWMELGFYLCA